MRILGVMLGTVAVIALLAGSALAQKGPAKYGEPDKDKTPNEKAAEKEAERAYQRSLGNIPEQQKTDPWGIAREPSNAAKASPAKPKPKAEAKSADTKSGNTAK